MKLGTRQTPVQELLDRAVEALRHVLTVVAIGAGVAMTRQCGGGASRVSKAPRRGFVCVSTPSATWASLECSSREMSCKQTKARPIQRRVASI